jgi:DNA helicase-2/ATP-dependent DNA helicase PcrA
MLSVNYRSNHWIVELGYNVVEYIKHRVPKRMHATREGKQGPQYIRPVDLASEAEIISANIRKRLMRGQAPETIAVLYRAHPAAVQLLECLMAKEIPINGDYLETDSV